MKRIILSAMLVGLAASGYSVESRLTGESSYFESAEINTSASELPMSPYKDGTIAFFRNDTAYTFKPNMEAGIDTIMICQELMGLGIEGTFAFDSKSNKLYFSKKNGADNDLFEATWKGDKWGGVQMMQIRGVAMQLIPMDFTICANWSWGNRILQPFPRQRWQAHLFLRRV